MKPVCTAEGVTLEGSLHYLLCPGGQLNYLPHCWLSQSALLSPQVQLRGQEATS